MNIFKALKKEIEKGNLCVTNSGDIISVEKYSQQVKKEYLDKAKGGEIDITKMSFNDYLALHRKFVNTAVVLKDLEKIISNYIKTVNEQQDLDSTEN